MRTKLFARKKPDFKFFYLKMINGTQKNDSLTFNFLKIGKKYSIYSGKSALEDFSIPQRFFTNEMIPLFVVFVIKNFILPKIP